MRPCFPGTGQYISFPQMHGVLSLSVVILPLFWAIAASPHKSVSDSALEETGDDELLQLIDRLISLEKRKSFQGECTLVCKFPPEF